MQFGYWNMQLCVLIDIVVLQDHKERLSNWSIVSFPFLVLGLFLALLGMYVSLELFLECSSISSET